MRPPITTFRMWIPCLVWHRCVVAGCKNKLRANWQLAAVHVRFHKYSGWYEIRGLDIKSTFFHPPDAGGHDPPFVKYDGVAPARLLKPIYGPRNLRSLPSFEIPYPYRTIDAKTDTTTIRQ